MPSRLTQLLVLAATLVNSILAGSSVNGMLVQRPAWQETGPLGWAAFSQHADLAAGLVIYPMEAIAGTLLSIAVVVSFLRDRREPRSAALPIYGAALMTIMVLLVTAEAAPIMLSVPTLGNDAAALQQAMDGFQFWGNIRGAFHILAFVANLWSLVLIMRSASGSPALLRSKS